MSFFAEKAPAAAGQTSPSLIYCREDLTKLDILYKISGKSFLPKKKAPEATGKTSTELPPQNGKVKWPFHMSYFEKEIQCFVSSGPPPSVKKSYPISIKNDLQKPKRAHKKVYTARHTGIAPGAKTGSWKTVIRYIIVYYPTLSYIILYYFILSYIILYYHILSYIILYYPRFPWIISYYPILSYIILYYPILSDLPHSWTPLPFMRHAPCPHHSHAPPVQPPMNPGSRMQDLKTCTLDQAARIRYLRSWSKVDPNT